MSRIAFLVVLSLCVSVAHAGLVQQLNSAGFTGFVNLLEHAEMVQELDGQANGGSELTLFVPTNDALMQKVSPALLAFLKLPTNREVLRKVLLNHVVPKRVSAFKWEGSIETLEGTPLTLEMDRLAFYAGKQPVRQYNAIISDGLTVHSISGLIVPSHLSSTLASVDVAAALDDNADDEDADFRRILNGASAASPSSQPASHPGKNGSGGNGSSGNGTKPSTRTAVAYHLLMVIAAAMAAPLLF